MSRFENPAFVEIGQRFMDYRRDTAGAFPNEAEEDALLAQWAQESGVEPSEAIAYVAESEEFLRQVDRSAAQGALRNGL